MSDIMEDLTLPPPCITIESDIVRTATFTPAPPTVDRTNASEHQLWSQEEQRFQPEEMARVAKYEADAKLCRLLTMTNDEYMAVLQDARADFEDNTRYLLAYQAWMTGQVAEWIIREYNQHTAPTQSAMLREIHDSTLEELQVDYDDVLGFTDEQAAEFLESMRTARLTHDMNLECLEVMTPDQTQHPEAQEVPPADAPEWTHLDFLLTEQQQELVERVQERKRRENILRTALHVNDMLTRTDTTGNTCCINETAERFMRKKRVRDILFQELNRI